MLPGKGQIGTAVVLRCINIISNVSGGMTVSAVFFAVVRMIELSDRRYYYDINAENVAELPRGKLHTRY